MQTRDPQVLGEHLALDCPLRVISSFDGGECIINFVDIPGCMTHVASLDGVPPSATVVRTRWMNQRLKGAPLRPSEYSEELLFRLPRSPHRQLVESAHRDGVRLNQSVVALFSQGVCWSGWNAGWRSSKRGWRSNRPRWLRAAE